MSDQTICTNLQSLIKLHGNLSLSELARETNIPQPTLHHIIDGTTKKPRKHVLESLADFFKITIPQLIGDIPLTPGIPESIKNSLNISTIPIITWEMVKDWGQKPLASAKFDEVIINNKIGENSFAIKLTTDRYEPMFHDNSLLIFDPSKRPSQRDFVVVYLHKYREIEFNRLFIDENIFYVKKNKDNGDADLIKIDPSKDRIIATLTEARLQF